MPEAERQKQDLEETVYSLFRAWKGTKWICLNPAINLANQFDWKDHWYFVGFDEQPVFQVFDGYPAWVANESILTAEQEWGKWFFHFSSKDVFFRDYPLQVSKHEFISPRWFCWHLLNEETGEFEHFYTEDIDLSQYDVGDKLEAADEFLRQQTLEQAIRILEK